MKKPCLKKLLPLLSLLLLAPWPVAYAYDNGYSSNLNDTARIIPAQAEAAPKLAVRGGTVNGVTPGDLFYIDAVGSGADIKATLYLTNAADLVPYYQYVILQVGVYVQDMESSISRTFHPQVQPAHSGTILKGESHEQGSRIPDRGT